MSGFDHPCRARPGGFRPDTGQVPDSPAFLVLMPCAAFLAFLALFLAFAACPLADMALALGFTPGHAGASLLW